jgi:flagellar biogenesis protein FliO
MCNTVPRLNAIVGTFVGGFIFGILLVFFVTWIIRVLMRRRQKGRAVKARDTDEEFFGGQNHVQVKPEGEQGALGTRPLGA